MTSPTTKQSVKPESAFTGRPVRVSATSGRIGPELVVQTSDARQTTWLEVALRMLNLPTAPFHEHRVLAEIRAAASAAGVAARSDGWGNLVIDLPGDGSSDAPPLVLSAHTDHPGFWAQGMRDKRTLLAHWVGRVPRDYFLGAEAKFTALATESQTSGPPVLGRITRVCEYRGEGDHAEVEIDVDTPVSPGAIGQWALPPAEVVDGRIHATAIDDVAGAAALLCVMSELVATGSPRPVSLLFTRAEEAGFVGCIGYCRDQLAAGHRNTQQIIGIEMSKAMLDAPVGGGPVVRVGDRRSVFDPGTTDDCARAGDLLRQQDPTFRYQRKLMDGGTCESSVFQGYLGRSGAVCLPLGNYHNVDEQNRCIDREFIDVEDFHGLVRLLLQIVESPVSDAKPEATQPLVDWCGGLWNRHHHLLFEPTSAPKGDA